MFNFNFHNPTRILFGKDQVQGISEYVPAGAKVLITYGGGSAKRSGLIDRVRAALPGHDVLEFGGIEPNPHYATLIKAAEVVRSENVDFLMAVGGGSVIDGTKFIALASHYDGDAAKLLHFGMTDIGADIVEKVVPLGTVLTIPATGSEMNCGAVISHEGAKYPVYSERVFPLFSVLDPTITFTLPKIQVANGIVDTFVHTTEAYLTFPVDARVQDRLCEGILQTLIEIGVTSVNEPENYDVRANHMWCSTMALNGLTSVGTAFDGATHMIGHELTALYGIDHGQTLAVVLPSLLNVQRVQKKAKLLQFAERVWGITEGTDDEKIDAAIAKMRAFFESLGIKTRMSEYGLGADKIPEIVNNLREHGWTALSETRDITPEVSARILEGAL